MSEMYGTEAHMARDYPLHHALGQETEKLGIDDLAFKLVQFVQWLRSEKRIEICEEVDEFAAYWPTPQNVQRLAFEFFDVSYDEYMREKDRMLIAIRRAQGFSDQGSDQLSEEEQAAQKRKVMEKGWRT